MKDHCYNKDVSRDSSRTASKPPEGIWHTGKMTHIDTTSAAYHHGVKAAQQALQEFAEQLNGDAEVVSDVECGNCGDFLGEEDNCVRCYMEYVRVHSCPDPSAHELDEAAIRAEERAKIRKVLLADLASYIDSIDAYIIAKEWAKAAEYTAMRDALSYFANRECMVKPYS